MIGPIIQFTDCEIFVTHHLLEINTEKSPIILLALGHMFHGSLEPPQRSLGEERGLDDPAGLTLYNGLQITLYAHIGARQAVPLVMGPGPKALLPLPPPASVFWEEGAFIQAPLYAHVQHIVVDLEEPRNLRPTIGWQASGAMHQPAYGLRRTVLCWMEKWGRRSLQLSLLDPHKYARILPQNWFFRDAIESSRLNQQSTENVPSTHSGE